MKLTDILESSVIPHNKINELPPISCDLKTAKTGQTFSCTLYRGQYKNIHDTSRGLFFTPSLSDAINYGTYNANNLARGKNQLIVKNFRFDNPFVCTSTNEALQYLIDKQVVTKAIGHKLMYEGAYAFPPAERIIASGFRQLGFDAIIYNKGLDEVVVLR